MRYLHHEVHELDGYNHEFWKTSGYSLKCVLELVASTSHAKVPSKAPHSALTNVFEDLDFLSNYWAANRIKPLVARSTNGIFIWIYLWIKVVLTSSGTSQFWNKSNVILFYSLWSSWPFFTIWRWWHIGSAPTNHHKTGSRLPKKIIRGKRAHSQTRCLTARVINK